MKCPEDADKTKDDKMCRAFNSGELGICTRLKGHKGKHHAHCNDDSCLRVWK